MSSSQVFPLPDGYCRSRIRWNIASDKFVISISIKELSRRSSIDFLRAPLPLIRLSQRQCVFTLACSLDFSLIKTSTPINSLFLEVFLNNHYNVIPRLIKVVSTLSTSAARSVTPPRTMVRRRRTSLCVTDPLRHPSVSSLETSTSF